MTSYMLKLGAPALVIATLSGCVANQAKVSMLQAPEVADASKYKTISVARFNGQYGDVVSNDLEASLMNAKIQDKPVYRSVIRAGESRSIGGDPRSLASTARSLGTEAIFTGEVTRADVNDVHRQEKNFVCDRVEDPKKFFSKCISGHDEIVNCIDRTAFMEVQVKLIDAQNGNQVYAEAISKSDKDTGCGYTAPKDGRVMLGGLKAQILDQIQKKVVPHDRVVNIDLMEIDDGLRSDAARKRFDGALKFAKEGRMDRACDMFRDIYDAEKKSVSLTYNLGLCEEAAGAFWKADEYYRIADRMTNEPNRILTAALTRNTANLKKAGSLAQHRSDLVGNSTIEAGAAPQSVNKTANSVAALDKAVQAVPQTPQNIDPEILMLEKRTALVIGNAAYKKGALLNPVNDARGIADVLRKLNFKVIEIEDAGMAKMGMAIDEFGRAIKEGGIALVFYAGHGMQVKGENYLVPVDADFKSENDVPYKSVALGQILSKLEDAKPRVNIVMLDACRDNPFARSWRSAKGGLATIDAPSGTVIAFATAPGKTAADGSGSNGLYTSHLLKQLTVPNLRIEDVLKNTRKAVAAESNNEQIPWDSSSLTGEFYFKVSADKLAAPTTPPVPDSANIKARAAEPVVANQPEAATIVTTSRSSAPMADTSKEAPSQGGGLGSFLGGLKELVKSLPGN